MKITSKILFLSCLLPVALIFSGCASTPTSPSGMPLVKLGPDFQMPAPGKTKVIFIRPDGMGAAFHFGIHDGRQLIGSAGGGGYFVYDCNPGPHLFSTSMENLSYLEADLSPDRIYYIKVQAVMGIWTPQVEMDPLYPGCPDIKWQKMPKILSHLDKSVLSSNAVAGDLPRIDGYMQRLKSYQDKGKGGKIFTVYGQTNSLSAE